MIKYRPERSSISLSLKEEKLFDNMDDLRQFVYEHWRNVVSYMGANDAFKPDEIIIEDNIGDDPITGYRNVRRVCVKRLLNAVYQTPRCIGYCGE